MTEHTDTSEERALLEDADDSVSEPLRGGSRLGRARGAVSRAARRGLPTRDLTLSILVAFNFAVAYPVLDVLGRHPEFFTARSSPWVDLVGLAVVLTVVAPLLLAVAVRACVAVHQLLGLAVHAVLLTVLLAMLGLRVLTSVELGAPVQAWLLPTAALLAAAAVVGAFYASRGMRAFVRAGVIAPVGFAALFLLASPASSLVLPADEDAAVQAQTREPVPVVMLVTDELPLATLLDGDADGIDAERFENFARFADDATWFTNTTTNHAFTSNALPALLTGRRASGDAEPTAQGHPVNLFTLLGGDYRIWESEHLTQLCPEEVCTDSRASATGRWRVLVTDMGVVGLHTLLPDFLGGDQLPPIDHAWAGFAGEDVAAGQERDYGDFLENLAPRAGEATLHYYHLPKPHFPWRQLPSGQYYTRGDETPGLVPTERGLRWTDEEWPVVQAWQRHLFQTGAVDTKLGQLLDRLHETGLYDDALVVVLSDHGVAFQPGESMRHVTGANVADVAFVPLLIKQPGQTEGRQVDRPAQLVDVLPTVLDLLDTRTDHDFDGRPLLADEPASGGDDPRQPSRDERPSAGSRRRLIESYDRTRVVNAGPTDVADRVAARTRLFGDDGWGSVWRLGPRPELLDRRLTDLEGRVDQSARVTLDEPGRYADVDPDAEDVPAAFVTGTLTADEPLTEPVDLAVAVNGRVVATGRTFEHEGRRAQISVLVPPKAYRKDRTDVQVVALRPEP